MERTVALCPANKTQPATSLAVSMDTVKPLVNDSLSKSRLALTMTWLVRGPTGYSNFLVAVIAPGVPTKPKRTTFALGTGRIQLTLPTTASDGQVFIFAVAVLLASSSSDKITVAIFIRFSKVKESAGPAFSTARQQSS